MLYVDFEFYNKTYFLFAYRKNEQEDITGKQKRMFRELVGSLLDELRQKKKV